MVFHAADGIPDSSLASVLTWALFPLLRVGAVFGDYPLVNHHWYRALVLESGPRRVDNTSFIVLVQMI